VFYALHRRYRPGYYESWKYIAPIQKVAWSRRSFESGTQKLIVMGLIAHTCVQATVLYAAELGYEVTVVLGIYLTQLHPHRTEAGGANDRFSSSAFAACQSRTDHTKRWSAPPHMHAALEVNLLVTTI
jgi:hypothetical protein